jgi:hypothetical protein
MQYLIDIRSLDGSDFLNAIQQIKHDLDNRIDETIPYIVLCNEDQLKSIPFNAVKDRTVVLKHYWDIIPRCEDHTYNPKYNTPEKAQAKKRERESLNGWVVHKRWGYKTHYVNGVIHKDDGPARVYDYGRVIWYKNGKKHKEDGLADVNTDGTGNYWLNGRWFSDDEAKYKRELLKYQSKKCNDTLMNKSIEELVKIGYELKMSKDGRTIRLTAPKYSV